MFEKRDVHLKEPLYGKAMYKNRHYYIVARADWDSNDVSRGPKKPVPVMSKSGAVLLMTGWGRKVWAKIEEIEVLKVYGSPQTILKLRKYAESKAAESNKKLGSPPESGDQSEKLVSDK